jgi:hypothetical protein
MGYERDVVARACAETDRSQSTLLARQRVMATKSNGSTVTARRLHDDIEHIFHPRRDVDGDRVVELENKAKELAESAWCAMKRHPFVSLLVIGAGGVALAASVGVGELAFGAALAIAAYKVLREGEPPIQAVEEVERDVRST